MQNSIQREITLRASMQRIYSAIADPDQVVQWFPETLEGKYAVGEQPIFGFGEHGRNQLYIEAANPYDYFAYRWVPGGDHFIGDVLSVANTLVEFRLRDLGDGRCSLTLTETGFAKLPAAVAEKSFTQNSGGWDFMLARLVTKMTEA